MVSHFDKTSDNSVAVSYRRGRHQIYTLMYAAIPTAFLTLWQWQTSGRFSLLATAIFGAFFWIATVSGDFFLRFSRLPKQLTTSRSFQLLFGYFVLNTCVAVVALGSTFGIAACFVGTAVLFLAISFVSVLRSEEPTERTTVVPDLLCITISGAAATLWCADALSQPVVEGTNTIFTVWQDSFLHMRLISSFSQAHGFRSLSDIEMAGARPALYHYGSYFLPAALMSLTGASAWDAFAGFQLPFGILLTGLAAFAFVSSLWNFWSGLAASCALLLLPDPYQHGFANRFLSYNFLQQINLAGLYGVSCAALAWIFLLNGCRAGKYSSVVLGYAFILLSLFYKSHIFVANAFLALMYPCLFFRGMRPGWRAVVAIVFIFVFALAVGMSQAIDGFPVLRLDFSSGGAYELTLLETYDPSFLQDFFASHILYPQPKFMLLFYYACMILISSFGLMGMFCMALMIVLRKQLEPAILFFPLLLVINYLVMALGLALDNHAIGTPDELLNRPVVWAYFGMVAWTAGAYYNFAFGSEPPPVGFARNLIAICLLSSFAVPLFSGRDLQTFPARRGYMSFADFNSFPSCLVTAALYVREYSGSSDIVQDSLNDPKFLVGALAERQDFAVDVGTTSGRNPRGLEERLDALTAFRSMTEKRDIVEFAVKNKISWYLLRAETKVSWPASFQNEFVYHCGGYRVYRFKDAASA